MPKKLLQKEIEEIINGFFNGKTIEELAKEFSCTKITINRHLKKSIEEGRYKQIILQNNKKKEIATNIKTDSSSENFDKTFYEEKDLIHSFSDSKFVEIAPLEYEIDNTPQKDLTSIPR